MSVGEQSSIVTTGEEKQKRSASELSHGVDPQFAIDLTTMGETDEWKSFT